MKQTKAPISVYLDVNKTTKKIFIKSHSKKVLVKKWKRV